MSDILLIQPPQWYPVSPHLAVPLLTGQLKNRGFNTTAYDLNIEFYNHILTGNHLKESFEKAQIILSELEPFCQKADADTLRASGSYNDITRYLKYTFIKDFIAKNQKEISTTIKHIENAVKVTKDAVAFYIPEKLSEAKHTIRMALKIASLPFAPTQIDLDNYFFNPAFLLDWKNVKLMVRDISSNMFYEYFDTYTDTLIDKNHKIISVSMTDLSQLVSVLTLTRMLKAKTNAKIIVGGNYATQIYKEIMTYKDIFEEYFDFLVFGDGEVSLPALCDCIINNKGNLKDISNLVYLNENKEVISTDFSTKKINLDSLAYADFSDYDLTKYFTPDPTFPIQLSKGCYWGKCSFCDYAFGQQGYCPKSIDRIIDEITYYTEHYNAKNFMFVDEAIPPKFYNNLALAIIEKGLDIKFYSFARLETGYTPDVLENLYKAGARLFLWGYECHSKRVMSLMNKGIDVEKRLEIFADSRKAGIWNNGLFMFGYPTETLEETEETMEIIRKNRNIIPSCTLSNFSLKKNSKLKNEIGKNGVKSYTSGGEFYVVYKDVIDGISQADRRELRRKFQFDFLEETAHSMWSVVFSDFDHLLAYLGKYGCDYVSSYRSEKRICPEFN